MEPESLERIEKLNYLLGAVLVVAAAVMMTNRFALGVLVGVALTCINFTFIRRLASKLSTIAPEKRGITAFYLVPKMAGLLAVATLCMFFLPISPIGMGIGFSVFFLSIMAESIRFMTGTTLSL